MVDEQLPFASVGTFSSNMALRQQDGYPNATYSTSTDTITAPVTLTSTCTDNILSTVGAEGL